MHKKGHKQKYSNRPSASDIPEQKRLEQERKVSDIENLKLHGRESTMQKFVNESTFINLYERGNLWEQWYASGKPKVTQWSNEEFTKHKKVFNSPGAWFDGKPRAFYNPINHEMVIPHGDVDSYFAELAHAAQYKSEDEDRSLSLWERLKGPFESARYGEGTYSTPGTIEHGAHRVIEPQMKKEYGEASRTQDVWTTPTSSNFPFSSTDIGRIPPQFRYTHRIVGN
tara:strand:- start:141 stop:818 length:678 start_codon:yes stop_codon:yes gene_type:complete